MHDLLLLLSNYRLLFGYPPVDLSLGLGLLPSHELIAFHLSDALLLLNHSVLRRIFLILLLIEDVLALPVLRLQVFLLLRLLFLTQIDRLLDLLSLHFPLFPHRVYLILVLLLDHLIHAHLLHLLVHSLLVSLLQVVHLLRSLLSLLYLFPGLHLFLLQQGYTIRQ